MTRTFEKLHYKKQSWHNRMVVRNGLLLFFLVCFVKGKIIIRLEDSFPIVLQRNLFRFQS